MFPGYALSFKQLKLCLTECHKLQSVQWVHFSGGEPTLWKEGILDLVDLLIEISSSGFEPGFTTNGSYFIDYNKCSNLFLRYLDSSNKPLHIYLSIDTFHDNFDVKSRRAKSMDNVLKCKSNLTPEEAELLDLTLIAVISKDTKSLIPDDMIEYYDALGVKFNFIPLQPKGNGRSYTHLCPNLNSDKPEDMGAYYRFRKKEPKKRTNERSNLVLIGNNYYLPDPWQKVAQLGHLPMNIINAYSLKDEDMKDRDEGPSKGR